MPRIITCLLLPFTWLTPAVFAQTDDIETIVVYAQSPLGFTLSQQEQVMAQQQLTADSFSPQQGVSLARMLDNQLNSITINDVQNNPFQADLQYRGFTASPLLGLPQGLAVYVNGSRFNEPFGDTVNWDLLPPSALQTATLVSGAHPVFGQNALGGALVLSTKTGFSFEDNKVTLNSGSDGQAGINLETGGSDGTWGYYLNLNHYKENGWRDFSPSRINQALATLAYHDKHHQSLLTLATNDSDLVGNGAIPSELIAYEGYRSVFTRPDHTNTALTLINFNHAWQYSPVTSVRMNAYFRQNDITTFNGDDSDYEACEGEFGLTLCEETDDDDEEGEEDLAETIHLRGFDENTALSALTTLDMDTLDGTVNTSLTRNTSRGISIELASHSQWQSLQHQWLIGAGTDSASIAFHSDTEFAVLNNNTIDDSRDVTGIGFYDADSMVRLSTQVASQYLYVSDVINWSSRWQTVVSARYNRSQIDMTDGIEEGEGSLNGHHRFHRLNPAISLHYRSDPLHIYVSYSQSTRTPSPAELSCADEDDPCKLPNGFVADPPLDQVITDTWEAGIDGEADNTQWHAGVYHSDSRDDIIFQQAGDRRSVGYFVNIERTRRVGAEFTLSRQWENLTLATSLSYLKATFESPFTSFSPQNPLGGDRQVEPGDTIPGMPRWQAGIEAHYYFTPHWSVMVDADVADGQYFRGDEANENRKLSGYTLANVTLLYENDSGLNAGVRLENVFNLRFETFGTYGEADEVLGELYPDIESSEFVGVGQPRMVRVFASWTF